MSYTIPARLSATCEYKPEWVLWRERLPTTLATLAQRWELTLGTPFDDRNVSCSWVAPARRADGTSVIFKLGLPHMEAEHEYAGLQFWRDAGAVQVYEHDPESGAYIMERCEPGTPLRTLPEPEQDEVLACVLERLWQRPTGAVFRPLSTMLQLWGDETRADHARWPDPGLVREGLALFDALSRPAPDDVLLATDLHAGNILAAQREPWLVIDVKPFVGDRHYDITQHLLHNCEAHLRADPTGLIQRVSDLLHLDAERVRLWCFARAAAESRDSWDDFSLAHLLDSPIIGG